MASNVPIKRKMSDE